jgi:hypothetical protein
LPPRWNDLAFPPDGVRHDEIEQSAFFGGLLLFEQPVHVSRIDLNDGRAFCQSEHLAAEISRAYR